MCYCLSGNDIVNHREQRRNNHRVTVHPQSHGERAITNRKDTSNDIWRKTLQYISTGEAQLPAKNRTTNPRTDVSFTLNARGHCLTVKDRSETINIYLIYCKTVIYKIITFSDLCKAHTILIVLSYNIYFSIVRIASNK